MKKIIIFTITALALMPVMSIAGVDKTGNGAPSGPHYNLNIIGVSKDKTAEMTDGNGHVIFVNLEGKSKIELQKAPEGESFKVLDANATDGPAKFQLPDPGLEPYVVGEDEGKDTMSDYSVFVRPLGTPGGSAIMMTCAEMVNMGILSGKIGKTIYNADQGLCSVEQVGTEITYRDKGKSTFTNVTAELLTIVFAIDIDGDGTNDEYVRVPIFDDSLLGEYWDYNNNGLKVLQVRFYPGVETDVSDGDDALPEL